MPSKDIMSISQFQTSKGQQQSQLYPRVYALPQFFTSNLMHEKRTVKIFTGQNAVLKAFYFNYMKLAIQSDNSQEYIQLLKEMFVSFDIIDEGQLEDKFLSDFQYRKFFKDFIQIATGMFTPNFQQVANKYPIIDPILQKLFKTVVPIALFLPDEDCEIQNDFQIVIQIINFLSQQFQQEYQIEIQGQCIKFQATEMFLYVENLRQIYVAFIDENNEKQIINAFNNSASSSFVCGEGNSFTSKFKSNNLTSKTTKHPFKVASLYGQEVNITKRSNKSLGFQSLKTGQKLKIQNTDQCFIGQNQRKSSFLESNSSLIQRRSKLLNPTKIIDQQAQKSYSRKNPSPIFQPRSCYQYQQMQLAPNKSQLRISSQNSSESNYSPIKEMSRQQQKANTLINILDSRVSQFDEINQVHLPLKYMEKMAEKGGVIMRRKSNNNLNKSRDGFIKETINSQSYEQWDNNKKYQGHNQFQQKSISMPQGSSYNQIKLPQPIQSQQNLAKPSSTIFLNTKHSLYYKMQKIQQLGQDQDQQNTIKDFCQIQVQNVSSHQQKTVTLSDNISHKLVIERIQSRDVNLSRTSTANLSRTSIGNNINSPQKISKLSFFQKHNQKQTINEKSQYKCFEHQASQIKSGSSYLSHQRKPHKLFAKSYQQYMNQMKNSFPFKQQKSNLSHQNQINLNVKDLQVNTIADNKVFKNQNNIKIQSNIKVSRRGDADFKLTMGSSKNKNVKFNQSSPVEGLEMMNKQNKPQIFQESDDKISQGFSNKHQQNDLFINQKSLNILRQQQSLGKRRESIHSSISSMSNDQFTKSYILILLDQQYRNKIRQIKNQYKSTIKQQHNMYSNINSDVLHSRPYSQSYTNDEFKQKFQNKYNKYNNKELQSNSKILDMYDCKSNQNTMNNYVQDQLKTLTNNSRQSNNKSQNNRPRDTSIYAQ